MDSTQVIAARIKDLCVAKNITANKMLLSCGINTSFITDLNRGQKPSVDKICTIATFFSVTTDYLLTGKESNFNGKENSPMNKNSYKVPENKLAKYLVKAMRDLFSYEDIKREINMEYGYDYGEGGFGLGGYSGGKERIEVDDFNVPIENSTNLICKWSQEKCPEISLSYERMLGFIELYNAIVKCMNNLKACNMSEQERYKRYPNKDEFENIALYVEKKKEYEPIFDILEKWELSAKVS